MAMNFIGRDTGSTAIRHSSDNENGPIAGGAILDIADATLSLRETAEQSLRQGHWKQAAGIFQSICRPDSATQARQILARNLADLQQYRPEIYACLCALEPIDRYQRIRAKRGRISISMHDGANAIPLSPGNDPHVALMQAWDRTKAYREAGQPLALCGLGDGYVLGALARFAPRLPLGREQAVFVIEPDPRLLLTCLAIHDYSSPGGPIQQDRFHWFIGQEWAEDFRKAFEADCYLPFPEGNIAQGTTAVDIEIVLASALKELAGCDATFASQANAIYDKRSARDLASLFDSNPPRRPRVLLVTSRFTTVLQYSTADAAEAFDELGWDARTVIEPTSHHSLRRHAMWKAVIEFEPDLVLVIDHLRHEYGGVFPPALPFACWIQDHLPNLTNRQAGESVHLRDFILTAIGTHFVGHHGYPLRQIVDLPNLSKSPALPRQWTSDGLDLVYISNWSRTTDDIVDEVLSQASAAPQLRTIADAAIVQMLGIYERGDCISTQRQVRQQLEIAQNRCGVAISDPQLMDGFINLLWDRLNNHLYRHQALHWTAEIAEKIGLNLGIYGRGWEKHPVFGRLAKGIVKPGAALENLVRRSKINLQLEPFACFTHPRLLGGLFAGGFFLIRDHPFNHLTQKLLNFLTAKFDESVETSADARKNVLPHLRNQLEQLLIECEPVAEQADAIQLARNWQRSGLLLPAEQAIPHLADVTFSDQANLRLKIEKFLNDPAARLSTAGAQRADLQSRLSYTAGLLRMCRHIGDLLRTEPAGLSTSERACD